MSAPNDAAPESGDRDATRYGPTPPADPAATRYSGTPADADPAATRYSDASADLHGAHSPAAGGTTVPGSRFRVLRLHAKGGLGKVFVAHDEELHRDVALKEIQGQYAHDPDSRARFLVEAEITGGLEHPGIVPIYSMGQYADGRPFYAMRFIKGDSLKEAIERFHTPEAKRRPAGEQALELRKLLGRFVDVCEAIAYAHSRGVLHRDLKPGNVMLGKYGETLVVDWGLAKPIGAKEAKESEEPALQPVSAIGSAETLPGKAIGTPQFMSPEQAAGRLEQMGPASDVYGLGATLYNLLTGKAPFPPILHDRYPQPDAKPMQEVLEMVCGGRFPRPREIQPAIDTTLESICLKAMALKPEDRFASPLTLAEALEAWLADRPSATRAVAALLQAIESILPKERGSHKLWATDGGQCRELELLCVLHDALDHLVLASLDGLSADVLERLDKLEDVKYDVNIYYPPAALDENFERTLRLGTLGFLARKELDRRKKG